MGMRLTLAAIPRGLLGGPCGSFTGLWSLQFHAGTPGFRESNGDGLFRRTRAMLAFADMIYFFPYKLTGLSAG